MTSIRDLAHARHLVATGEAAARMARTSQQAENLRIAFVERWEALGDLTTCAAIDEGKWLDSQIKELDCDWGDPVSPECEWHLH
jgi:hypothetical protein